MTTTISISESSPFGTYFLTFDPDSPRLIAAAEILLERLLSHPEPDDPRHARIVATLAAAGFVVTADRNGRRIEANYGRLTS